MQWLQISQICLTIMGEESFRIFADILSFPIIAIFVFVYMLCKIQYGPIQYLFVCTQGFAKSKNRARTELFWSLYICYDRYNVDRFNICLFALKIFQQKKTLGHQPYVSNVTLLADIRSLAHTLTVHGRNITPPPPPPKEDSDIWISYYMTIYAHSSPPPPPPNFKR